MRAHTFVSVLSMLSEEGTWSNPLPETALGTGGRAVLQQLWAGCSKGAFAQFPLPEVHSGHQSPPCGSLLRHRTLFLGEGLP